MENQIKFTDVIALLSFLFGIFTFIFYYFKTNRIERKYLKNEIDKQEKSKIELKKAVIVVEVNHLERGKKKIIVNNKGKSLAKQLKISVPDIDGILDVSKESVYDIEPQESISFIMYLGIVAKEMIDIEFEWSDEFSTNNRVKRQIQIKPSC